MPTNAALSVVIPAYNEAQRLPATLRRLRDYAEQSKRPIQVVVVNDGSTDATAAIVREFAPGPMRLSLLENDGNRGKGYTVRRGMLEADGDVLLLCDADMSTPIEEVQKLLPLMADGADVVIGSRDLPDSVVEPPRTFVRQLVHDLFRIVRSMLLLGDLRDTQCGFKAFGREVARQVFPLQTIEGYAFDCEVLALARRLGHEIREVGVVWNDDRRSRVHPVRDGLNMLISLFRIRRRIKTIQPGAANDAERNVQ